MWWRPLCADEGGISPAFVAILAVTLLLLMVVVDREWVNYSLKLAEQAADFAAEAGARSHEVYATVTVEREYYELVSSSCSSGTEGADQDRCVDDMRWEGPFSAPLTLPRMREQELVQTWREMAECGNPFNEAKREYTCQAVHVVDRQIVFPESAARLAEETFRLNLGSTGSAVTLREISATPWSGRSAHWSSSTEDQTASMILHVRVEIRSLFGLFPWHRAVPVVGRAVVRLEPLALLP